MTTTKTNQPFLVVPTWDKGTWTTTTFDTRGEFRDFIRALFKDMGPEEGYGFDEDTLVFQEEARRFQSQGLYCSAPFRSKDFMAYWDDQKEKCRKGVIVRGHKGMVWYLTRDYYMWLNFLPIFDKEEQRFDFAKVRDAQYHMALYELLAELEYKHASILKKRQIASSYFHMAKLINQWAFEEGSVCKIGASLKDYISEKGSWRMLNEYRTFLNEHTAWYRPSDPDKVFSWQQRIKVRIAGRDTYRGLKSIINGTSFEKDPTNGVGGPCRYFFHEEAGIAPKMDQTYEYMRPAMQSGMVTTGQFIAAGSVGDLDQCGPLKRFILKPEAHDMLAVETNLLDHKGTWGKSALFIPEHWSMPPYIDEWGNSLIADALEAIKRERGVWKRELSPEQYQLRISQKPINIEEAFAIRSEPVFPAHLVTAQLRRIEDKQYPVEYLDLYRDEDGKVAAKVSRKTPITEFPVPKTLEDKSGVICVYERPSKDAQWGTYYASVDPVGEGKTTTSDSLCAIYIYKNAIEVSRTEEDGKVTQYLEGDKIVASWCGRFDDLNKTHERLELLIEWYNAWALVEANVSLFIQYMIAKRKQKYLVPKDMILFLKELGSNRSAQQDYGWKNTGTLFKSHLLSYGIEFTKEVTDQDFKTDGTVVRTRYGIERIPDPMLLREMLEYQPGLNVDRLVAFCALVAFVTVQNSNRGNLKRVETTRATLENSSNLRKLRVSPFRHLGTSGNQTLRRPPRGAFRNLR